MVGGRAARAARRRAGMARNVSDGAVSEAPGRGWVRAPSDGDQQRWAGELLGSQIGDPTLVVPPPPPVQVRPDLGDVLLVAGDDTELQGAMWATRPATEAGAFADRGYHDLADWLTARFTELHALAVHPAHRRQGVATRLLRALDVTCVEQEQLAIFAVAADEPGLCKLYEDAGYRLLGIGQSLDLPMPDGRQIMSFPLQSVSNRWIVKTLP